ncbi:MAG: major capsid protein [Candidatus Kapabacteria bacterium]|nr:major capsid protein [Candidatus Kapabacteria bacterium]
MNIYEYRSLTNAVNKVKVVQPFLLNMFFKEGIERHDSDLILVELVESSARVARFAGKNSPPHPVKNRTRKAYEFKIPRTFESKPFTAEELSNFKESADGMYIGSAEDRKAQVRTKIIDEVKTLKERVINRRELMAAQSIVSGTVTVNEDGVIKTADYGFVPGTHLITYAGTSKWDGSAGDIAGDFVKYPRAIRRRTLDPSAQIVCILGTAAADVFRKDVTVQKELNTMNFKVGTLNLDNVPDISGTNFIGKYKGVYVYEYSQGVFDETNTEIEIFPVNRAVFGVKCADNRIHAGPIYRIDPETKQTIKIINEMYLDAVTDKYQQTLEWLLEQKSLTIVHDADRFVSIQVL